MEYQREYRRKHAAKVAASKKAWRDRNKAKDNATRRKNYAKRAATGWRHLRPVATRPTPQCCEACGIAFEKTARGACLDHDHNTNAFRGWLCQHCNTALGMVGDTREGVLRLLEYVDRAELLS